MAVVFIGLCGLIGGVFGLLCALVVGTQFLPAILFSLTGYFTAGLVAVCIITKNYILAEHAGERERLNSKGKIGLRLGSEFDVF